MSPYNPDIHHRHSIRLKGYNYASEGLYFVTICTQNRECFFGEIKNDEMVLNDAGRMVEKWYRKTQDKFPDIVCHEMVIMPNHFHCIWENVGLHGASAVGADPRVRPVNKNVRPVDKNVNPIENNAHDFENNVHHIDNNDGHIIKNVERHYDEGAHAGAPLQLNDTVLDTPNIIIVDKYNRDEGGHVGSHIQTNNMNLGTPNNNINKYGGDEGGHVGPHIQTNNMNLDTPNNNINKYNGDEGGHVGPPLQDTDLGTHTGSPLSSVVQWFKTMSTNEYIRGVKQSGWPPFDRKLWQRNYYEHIIRDDISLQTIAYYIINNPAQWRNDKFFQPTQSI